MFLGACSLCPIPGVLVGLTLCKMRPVREEDEEENHGDTTMSDITMEKRSSRYRESKRTNANANVHAKRTSRKDFVSPQRKMSNSREHRGNLGRKTSQRNILGNSNPRRSQRSRSRAGSVVAVDQYARASRRGTMGGHGDGHNAGGRRMSRSSGSTTHANAMQSSTYGSRAVMPKPTSPSAVISQYPSSTTYGHVPGYQHIAYGQQQQTATQYGQSPAPSAYQTYSPSSSQQQQQQHSQQHSQQQDKTAKLEAIRSTLIQRLTVLSTIPNVQPEQQRQFNEWLSALPYASGERVIAIAKQVRGQHIQRIT